MRVSSLEIFLLLLFIALGHRRVACTADAEKSGSGSKVRLKAPHSPWRLIICLTQQQTPVKIDIQRIWDEVRLESSQGKMEVTFVETTLATTSNSLSYTLMLLDKFCTALESGRSILNLVIGGGPAAKFLITAATSLNLPTLWLPSSHRDFLRQGEKGKFENRIGTGSKEVGAAAAALMHKANWHAFTLLIDVTLLPLNHLLLAELPVLTPRTVIHLPATEHTLRARLRLIAQGDGNGGILVMGCDLQTARQVVTVASEFGMLSGKFLWLWLDLKAELKLNESNLISSHAVHNARSSSIIQGNNIEHVDNNINLRPDDRIHLHTLPNLANDVHRLQEYRWQETPIVKRDERGTKSKDSEESRTNEKDLESKLFMPVGMLALRSIGTKSTNFEALLTRTLRDISDALDQTIFEARPKLARLRDTQTKEFFMPTCFAGPKILTNEPRENVSRILARRLAKATEQISRDKSEFHLLNLQPVANPGNRTLVRWTKVGTIKSGGRDIRLDTIIWPGGGILPAYQDGDKDGIPAYRIATALAPPFTMASPLQEGICLRGIACRQGDDTVCCYGLSMDLLALVARELGFRFELYIGQDGLFGRRLGENGKWNGLIGEILSGKAQMVFAPLSVSARRAEVVDFTTPYFFSGVSFLAAPRVKSEIPLLAFLLPFSTELWIAVFTSLNITAMAVATYEWLSPFGLNPWGRQRSKNFSIASALWVMWGLLCGHLVAFKAPKSWPNKFLINVWGGFSVIFVASYTANIAALIAGLFFHSAVNNYHDRSLLSQKVGAPRASVAEYYVQRANKELWSHMARFSLSDVAEGVERLRNGSLDILIADTPILNYYKATDNGCRLKKIGDTITEDTYAVAMVKGHPLKESISRVIANYTSNGLFDILQEKWYGGLPCIRNREGVDPGLDPEAGGQPRPLGVASVAGVFCLLGLGVVLGAVILAGEHLFYRYTLPRLRHRPSSSIWRSRNVMFFSQKLYRFINCVELVSPHHAARELVHSLRQGQITSLFQKSVKRKEHEQRRRRKSKAQFFEMIQEIRRYREIHSVKRVQQEEKTETTVSPKKSRGTAKKEEKTIKGRERSRSKSPLMPRSPKRNEKSKSSTNLSRPGLSPISLEEPMRPREFTLSNTNLRSRSPLETVGRRLSHGDGGSPPSRLGSQLGGSANLRPQAPMRGDSLGSDMTIPRYSRSPAKRGSSFPVFATLRPPPFSSAGAQLSRSPLLSPNNEVTSIIGRKLSREWGASSIDLGTSTTTMDCGVGKAQTQETTLIIEPIDRKKQKEEVSIEGIKKLPVRRARSHENRESVTQPIDVPSSRLTVQPVVGGRSVSERTKKQLESELKAILSARAHHRDLHPP